MTAQPIFTGLNVVVTDMDTTLAFYRLLGLDVEAVPICWPPRNRWPPCHSVISRWSTRRVRQHRTGPNLGTRRPRARHSSDWLLVRIA
jgi:hypothetical protein